jgi:hypothetical protein
MVSAACKAETNVSPSVYGAEADVFRSWERWGTAELFHYAGRLCRRRFLRKPRTLVRVRPDVSERHYVALRSVRGRWRSLRRGQGVHYCQSPVAPEADSQYSCVNGACVDSLAAGVTPPWEQAVIVLSLVGSECAYPTLSRR